MKHETDHENHTTTITKTVRITYKQDWPAYNAAQTNEKAHFQALLHDLCQGIEEPDQHMGRPRQSLRDMLFSTIFHLKANRRVSSSTNLLCYTIIEMIPYSPEPMCERNYAWIKELKKIYIPGLTPLVQLIIEPTLCAKRPSAHKVPD